MDAEEEKDFENKEQPYYVDRVVESDEAVGWLLSFVLGFVFAPVILCATGILVVCILGVLCG